MAEQEWHAVRNASWWWNYNELKMDVLALTTFPSGEEGRVLTGTKIKYRRSLAKPFLKDLICSEH